MRNLLIISLSLLSAVSYGQSSKFKFQLGSEYELPRKTEDLAFFGDSANGIINLSLKKDELNVIRFDPKSLNQTDDKVISLSEETKNFNSEQITSFHNGTSFWIHSDWDKENQKELLYYDKLDVAHAKFTATNVKINETTKIAGEGGGLMGMGGWGAMMRSMKVTGKYKYNYSADNKKLLVSYRLIPENRRDKDNYDKIGLVVYDDNLNKIWGNEFTMPYTEAIMDNSDYSVDSKGNAYMLAKVYESDKRKEVDKETGKAGYHYEVLKFTKDSKEITHTSVDIGDNFIKEASLIENPLHQMIIACTYSKKVKGNGTDGIFLAMMDQSGRIVKYKNGYYEFPLADLEKFESARSKRKMDRKDDYEQPDLQVRDIVTSSDGSIFITCEEYHVVVNTYTDANGSTTTTYTYYYQDILASKINADGKFAWLRKVPKDQRGPSTATFGFKLITDGSDYYFLYLDNRKNIDITEDDAPKSYGGGGGDVMVSKLDKDGNLTKELLFDTKDEDVKIFPTEFSQINGNQFIGRAKVRKNQYEPLLITVN